MRALPVHLARLAVTAALSVLAAGSAHAERPRIYALTGGEVQVAPGTTLAGGTVILRDGLIEVVGAGIEVPPDAVEIDCRGQWIYPGFIDPDTTLALAPDPSEERPAERGGRPPAGGPDPAAAARSGASHPVPRVHPERLARDRLLAFEGERKREAERHRGLGFTVALAAPRQGVFRGRSAAILLQDEVPVPALILRDDVAQHIGFDRGGFGEGYPSSLMGAVAAIRQTLLDGQRHGVWEERYARDPKGLRRPEGVAAYEALAPLLGGVEPAFFSVENPEDVLLADRLAREFSLRAAISATGHEWELAEAVAATGRTLILPVTPPEKPRVDDPDQALDVTLREMRRYLEAAEGPARLHAAGVEIAFTTRGLANLADFHRELSKRVEAGLPPEAALAALTTVPARLLGLEAVAGTLEAGKIANVVIADGALFGKDFKVRRVFVDGHEYRVEEKKKPKGDPNAVVDPRGEWSVVLELRGEAVQRTWTIAGERGSYSGTAETQGGTVAFDRVDLEGNALTVVFPPREGRAAAEVTVIVTGDSFEGVADMGGRSVPVKGTRTAGPEGGGR